MGNCISGGKLDIKIKLNRHYAKKICFVFVHIIFLIIEKSKNSQKNTKQQKKPAQKKNHQNHDANLRHRQQPIIPIVQQPAYMVVQQPIIKQQQLSCVHGKPLRHGQMVQTPMVQQIPVTSYQPVLQLNMPANKHHAQKHGQQNRGSQVPKKNSSRRK